MFKKIAIMGAGSMGTVLGSFLAKGGLDVTFIDADAEHIKALNENGAHIIGAMDFTVPAKAMVADSIEGKFDLIFFMSKQTFNDTAIPQMIAACKPETIICCCQNGIPEYEVAKYWPKDQICGAPMGWGASRRAPGVSEYTTEHDHAEFHLGSLDGVHHPWLDEVKKVLENMCKVIITGNLEGDRWSKVCFNAAWSGMSALTGGLFGDVMDDPDTMHCIELITREVVAVSKAGGIDIVPMMGMDWAALAPFENAEEQKHCEEEYLRCAYYGRGACASMLPDLRAGRKCELFYIDGVVAEMGDKTGIDTPFTDLVIKIVSEIEKGERGITFDNVKYFKPLLEKYSYLA
ncbi:MAG: 2-dehydropantoate 2-reductase [Lachnospiraceae bacterium]|nr:2-dehydropantoate 2-reductase [Lachnospiraceae bacterium]